MKTCDPATALDDIMAFVLSYIPRSYDDRPHTVRVAPDAYYRIRVVALQRRANPVDHLMGVALTVDETLPSGVWRVQATNGDLIRDSRSENNPNEGRRR